MNTKKTAADTVTKTSSAKKTATKKTSAKKTAAKKTATKKSSAKKTTRRKTPTRAPFEIAGHKVTAGKRMRLELPIGNLMSGTPVALPLIVVHGKKDGPVSG